MIFGRQYWGRMTGFPKNKKKIINKPTTNHLQIKNNNIDEEAHDINCPFGQSVFALLQNCLQKYYLFDGWQPVHRNLYFIFLYTNIHEFCCIAVELFLARGLFFMLWIGSSITIMWNKYLHSFFFLQYFSSFRLDFKIGAGFILGGLLYWYRVCAFLRLFSEMTLLPMNKYWR